jgi:hypothetical protein
MKEPVRFLMHVLEPEGNTVTAAPNLKNPSAMRPA